MKTKQIVWITTTLALILGSCAGLTVIVTNGNKRYLIGESLDTLEQELNPKDFFRANRQYLVSSRSITKINNFGNQKLKLSITPSDDDGIIISKLKATAFKNWIGS